MWQVHLMFLLGLFNLVLHGSVRTQPTVYISLTVTYQSFHIYQCSVVCRLFLRKNIILCCRWHGLAPEAQGAALLMSLLSTLCDVFPHWWHLQRHRVFWITAELFSALGAKALFFNVKYLSPKSNIPQKEYLQKDWLNFMLPSLWNEVQDKIICPLHLMSWKKYEMFSHNFTHVPLVACSLEHVCLIKAFHMLAISCLSALIKVMPSV